MRRYVRFAWVATLLLGVFLAATGGALARQASGLPPEMLDKTWRLVSLQAPGQSAEDTRGKGLTIVFSADGKVSGSGGCNSFNSTYEATSSGTLTIKQPFAATLKACEDAVSNLEQQYFTAIGTIDRYALDGATGLRLGYAAGKGELLYETAARPTMPATGGASDLAAVLLGLAALVLLAGLWLRTRASAVAVK
jgi:LPXTG-motif cell wall-anchored protein